jgi:acyl-CoA thioesterase FadM
MQEPTADLLPMVSKMYEQFLQQVNPGDVLTVMFRVQRL